MLVKRTELQLRVWSDVAFECVVVTTDSGWADQWARVSGRKTASRNL